MKRHEALKIILESFKKDDLAIFTTGMISREAFAAKDRPENFYMVGSMGLVTPLALGLALVCPGKKVIGVEGDGSVFLNLGSLAMVAREKPNNLSVIVIDNGCYESTGGQPCLSREVDVSKIAQAAGFVSAEKVEDKECLKEKLSAVLKSPGPTLLLVKVESSRQEGIPRVSHSPEEIKKIFMKVLSS